MSGNFDKSKDNLNKNAPKPETESNHRVESHTIEGLSKQALDQYIEKHPTAKSQVDVSGLNGNFSSPDGAKKLKVVDGALLDSSGSRLGQLRSDGKIVFFDSSAGPKGKQSVSDANLFFNNWKFSGKEKNQRLEFTTNKDASNGLITISSPEAKSVLGLAIDNTPAKLTIKCGMVLDGSGKQIGHFIPPRLENGILQGGFVKPLKSEGYFQLSQVGPATVDVQVLGQTGKKGQRLQCIYSADGKLLDVNALVANKAEQLKKLSEEVKELTFEHKNIFELATGALTGSHEELRRQERSESSKFQALTKTCRNILATGDVSSKVFTKLDADYKRILAERVIEQREQREQKNEALDKNKPQEKSHSNIPVLDAKAIASVNGRLRWNNDVFDIRQGKLYKQEVGLSNPISCGSLEPGYILKLKGQAPVSLAGESRVLLEFRLARTDNQSADRKGNESGKVHRLIGLGHSFYDSDGQPTKGGLVAVTDLKQEMAQIQKALHKDNKEYFEHRTHTGALLKQCGYDLANPGGSISSIAASVDTYANTIDRTIDKMFVKGFSEKSLDPRGLNSGIGVIALATKYAGISAADSATLRGQLGQSEHVIDESVKTGLISLVPIGVGAATLKAANRGIFASLGKYASLGATATRISGSAIIGGAARSAMSFESGQDLRKTASSFGHGMLEASLMSLGGGAAKLGRVQSLVPEVSTGLGSALKLEGKLITNVAEESVSELAKGATKGSAGQAAQEVVQEAAQETGKKVLENTGAGLSEFSKGSKLKLSPAEIERARQLGIVSQSDAWLLESKLGRFGQALSVNGYEIKLAKSALTVGEGAVQTAGFNYLHYLKTPEKDREAMAKTLFSPSSLAMGTAFMSLSHFGGSTIAHESKLWSPLRATPYLNKAYVKAPQLLEDFVQNAPHGVGSGFAFGGLNALPEQINAEYVKRKSELAKKQGLQEEQISDELIYKNFDWAKVVGQSTEAGAYASIPGVIAAGAFKNTLRNAESARPKDVVDSAKYFQNHEIAGALTDGWSNIGVADRHTIVVDLAKDKALQGIVNESFERFKGLKGDDLACALTAYVQSTQQSKLAESGKTLRQAENSYKKFAAKNKDESFLLGDLLQQEPHLSCNETATLLKVLMDAHGLDAKIVRGNGLGMEDKINHAWIALNDTSGVERVYDPSLGIYSRPYDQIKDSHKPASKMLKVDAGGNQALQFELEYGDVVSYKDQNWKVKGFDSSNGKFILSRDSHFLVKPDLLNKTSLDNLKPGSILELGALSGTKEKAVFEGIDKSGNLILSKPEAISKIVDAAELRSSLLEMVQNNAAVEAVGKIESVFSGVIDSGLNLDGWASDGKGTWQRVGANPWPQNLAASERDGWVKDSFGGWKKEKSADGIAIVETIVPGRYFKISRTSSDGSIEYMFMPGGKEVLKFPDDIALVNLKNKQAREEESRKKAEIIRDENKNMQTSYKERKVRTINEFMEELDRKEGVIDLNDPAQKTLAKKRLTKILDEFEREEVGLLSETLTPDVVGSLEKLAIAAGEISETPLDLSCEQNIGKIFREWFYRPSTNTKNMNIISTNNHYLLRRIADYLDSNSLYKNVKVEVSDIQAPGDESIVVFLPTSKNDKLSSEEDPGVLKITRGHTGIDGLKGNEPWLVPCKTNIDTCSQGKNDNSRLPRDYFSVYVQRLARPICLAEIKNSPTYEKLYKDIELQWENAGRVFTDNSPHNAQFGIYIENGQECLGLLDFRAVVTMQEVDAMVKLKSGNGVRGD